MSVAIGNKNNLTRLIAVVLTGIPADLSGMVLVPILHAIQHLAFGYSVGQIVGSVSFLQGVTESSWPRRIVAIVVGGGVAESGWWLPGRYGQKRVSTATAVANPSVSMPTGTTTIHVLLQIVIVVLGPPLGREVAPREIDALGAGMAARKLGLLEDKIRTLVACGAGAGLAAVYSVLLTEALFSLGVTPLSFSWEKTLAAIMTSAITAWTTTLGLGDESQYYFVSGTFPYSFLWWAILVGPILGTGAQLFRRTTSAARSCVRSNWQMPMSCLLGFPLLAIPSLYLPELPGNGKGPMQLALSDGLPLSMVAILLVLKMAVTLATLHGGAEGGSLTPELAVGGLVSLLLYAPWQLGFPGGDKSSSALVGAAAFLVALMRMPLTVVALAMEPTHTGHSYLAPALLCAAGVFLACRILDKKYSF